jgi:hypothetical protein
MARISRNVAELLGIPLDDPDVEQDELYASQYPDWHGSGMCDPEAEYGGRGIG